MKVVKQKTEQEQLFDELISVKSLYKSTETQWKQVPVESADKALIKNELLAMKNRISIIEQNIRCFGESFFDVYDSELISPLSESDILVLRDEIKEVRSSLEGLGK
jgi:hypothetical protein